MMKSITKFLAVGAIAAVAIAMSMAPSEAAKKRHKASAACTGPGLCSTNCSGGFCSVYLCGVDGAWYPAVLTPICPQGNCVNVRKKC
jgi:hypothetical protein